MNHVASGIARAYSPGPAVARKIARGRQIDERSQKIIEDVKKRRARKVRCSPRDNAK
ncbi:hypothetical protein ALC56_14472 [Trachymyrmex septentrionalis]|uniref:Uncharacterized protein n=1 Tax=Trachymyrmex septentrionalis TaxID=34720 RepID=A0A195ETK0_9HYME|nr:hypothetical protein ALC56_14472 [Trachymyrmex septentrionalis]